MTDRTRRAVLKAGVGALAGGAGCISHSDAANTGTSSDSPSNSTATTSPAEPAHLSFNHADPLHRRDAEYAQRDVGSYYLGLLTSPAHVAAFPTDAFGSEDAKSFITGTDFTHNAVVVLQDRQSSSHPDLELIDTNRTGDQVIIKAGYPGSAATGDITTDTLLVRVAANGSEPHAVSTVLHPAHDDPIRFSTLNSYDTDEQFTASGDLLLHTRDCSDAQLTATVTYQGDLFFQRGIDLSPLSSRRVGGLFGYAGEWTVTTRRGENTTTRTWSLTGDAPGDVLVTADGNGTISLSHHPDGVDQADSGTCETDDYPYESSSPEENLANPVDLWVLDHSDNAHQLTVTIRDGDTDVFSDEFDTREGYDKAKRAELLAKKTTYTIEVIIDGRSSTSETMNVQEGIEKLLVRVTAAEEVAISIE